MLFSLNEKFHNQKAIFLTSCVLEAVIYSRILYHLYKTGNELQYKNNKLINNIFF